MNSDIATSIPREDARQGVARRPWRLLAVQLLGPLTIVGGRRVGRGAAVPHRPPRTRGAGRLRLPLPAAAPGRPRRACSSRSRSRRGSSRTSSAWSRMVPRPESAHWLAGAVALLIGLLLIAEVLVGTEVFRRRAWRAYLFPAVVVVSSVLLWVITIFSTFSTMHLLAHAVWAQAALLAGAVQLALVRGKLRSPAWSLVPAFALLVSGAAFLVHEQNGWLYSRSAFLHHAIGWMLVVAALFPLGSGAASASGGLAGGVRRDVRAPRRAAVRGSRRRAHLRPLRARWAVKRVWAAARGRGPRAPRPEHGDCPRHAPARGAGDAVPARDGADGDPAPLQPAGDDHIERDPGARARRNGAVGDARDAGGRLRRRRAGLATRSRPGLHGALARDRRRRALPVRGLHVRGRRGGAAADRGRRSLRDHVARRPRAAGRSSARSRC